MFLRLAVRVRSRCDAVGEPFGLARDYIQLSFDFRAYCEIGFFVKPIVYFLRGRQQAYDSCDKWGCMLRVATSVQCPENVLRDVGATISEVARSTAEISRYHAVR